MPRRAKSGFNISSVINKVAKVKLVPDAINIVVKVAKLAMYQDVLKAVLSGQGLWSYDDSKLICKGN